MKFKKNRELDISQIRRIGNGSKSMVFGTALIKTVKKFAITNIYILRLFITHCVFDYNVTYREQTVNRQLAVQRGRRGRILPNPRLS